VLFSPDGTHLVLQSRGDLLLWHLGSGQLTARLTGHGGTVRDAAFSPDGRLLASVDSAGSLILWDATAYRRLSEPLLGPGDQEDARHFVRFTGDGHWLETASASLPAHPKTWIAEICGRLLSRAVPECVQAGE
jgi:WD40 repeat protein